MGEVLLGVNVPSVVAAGADPVAAARRAEALGFDFVSASDHLHGAQPTLEPWTLLAWIAASTERIGVATRVLAVPYRAPAVLAKMAETFDRLSGGRLILGLGGGAVDEEFTAFGLGTPTPREKVTGMEEAIRIAHGLWTRPSLTFSGQRYRTEGARIEPKPARRIPIWLGTYGRRALEVTGRLADGWIPSLGHAMPEQVPAMRGRILAAARAAGRAPEEIRCVYNLGLRLDARAEPRPDTVTGGPEEVAEQLLGFVKLGFTGLSLRLDDPDPAEQAERLAHEVLPALRAVA